MSEHSHEDGILKMPYSDLERTAIHEAGHVVMAVLRKFSIKCVSIVPTETMNGKMEYKPWSQVRYETDTKLTARCHLQVESDVLVSVAGMIAEEIVTGTNGNIHGQDMDDAEEIAAIRFGTKSTTDMYIEFAKTLAREILTYPPHRAAIEALARALLRENELTASAAKMIVRDVINEVSGKI